MPPRLVLLLHLLLPAAGLNPTTDLSTTDLSTTSTSETSTPTDTDTTDTPSTPPTIAPTSPSLAPRHV
ncbi:MAG: hypothetical protein JNK56_04420 [Myxococcales bacterium]|nr:hypothetical protein [Myxococcales bacterium]